MKSKGPSILVIDSGVGGLSICQSILALNNGIQLVYFADDAFFPYGLMEEETLRSRLKNIVANMLELHQPELVVLACNTVSTLVLPELRSTFDIPFVGVVPAIKPAAQLSKSKRIGLLATPATVKRPYTDKLIEDYAKGCQVIRVGTSELVVQAENYLSGKPVSEEVLSHALSSLVQHDVVAVDTVVLGCTHFPLLKPHLNALMPDIKWIDSGEAVAQRVITLLKTADRFKLEGGDKPQLDVQHQIYFSGAKPESKYFSEALKSLGVLDHDLHTIDL